MLGFSKKGTIREVDVPDDEVEDDLLELVYKYGQNDFQPRPIQSVSVGDVVELEDGYHVCCNTGWRLVSKEEFDTMEGNRGIEEMLSC